ncbi:MAG: fimbrial assembly protein [Acidobacteriota bacterium]
MKIAVNLASHPYIDLRPIYSRLRIWTLILAVVGGALWFLYRNEADEAQAARAHVAMVKNHVLDLEKKQQQYRQMMQRPKDAAILQQSEFLNSLFRRKAFSWTATMTDLETVLPGGVQVLSIDPITGPSGNVIIRLRVTGERDRELDLIRNLEKSKHFASPRLAAESLATAQGNPRLQTANTTNLVNFDILADYRPLPLEPSKAKAEEEAASPAAVEKAAPHKAKHATAAPKTAPQKPAHRKPSGATGGKKTP